MKLETLIQKAAAFPLFGDELCSALGEPPAKIHQQLSRWARAGKIIRLKRGLYTLPEGLRRSELSQHWLANTLYSPSYLSLETMLSWYDLIPERVMAVTSVTTLKTATFDNPLGRFVYRHLKPELFFGFEEKKDNRGAMTLIATPEKALLDYIYLRPRWQPTADFMEHNIRLQQLDQLDQKRLVEWGQRFKSRKMSKAVEALCAMT